MTDSTDVDTYLVQLPADSRATLEELRRCIRDVVPDTEEGLSYGVPAFKLKGKPLVCYAAFKNHCGFYPMSPKVLELLADELAGYETAKGTIRFPIGEPPAPSLVARVVQARLAELRG